MNAHDIETEAKLIVLTIGPANVLRLGDNLVTLVPDEHRPALLAEVRKQAERVWDFLGFAPWPHMAERTPDPTSTTDRSATS